MSLPHSKDDFFVVCLNQILFMVFDAPASVVLRNMLRVPLASPEQPDPMNYSISFTSEAPVTIKPTFWGSSSSLPPKPGQPPHHGNPCPLMSLPLTTCSSLIKSLLLKKDSNIFMIIYYNEIIKQQREFRKG